MDTGTIFSSSGLTHALVTGQSFACGVLGGPILSTVQTQGNLRDSDPALSQYGDMLFNWCVIFDKAI